MQPSLYEREDGVEFPLAKESSVVIVGPNFGIRCLIQRRREGEGGGVPCPIRHSAVYRDMTCMKRNLCMKRMVCDDFAGFHGSVGDRSGTPLKLQPKL